MTYEPTTSDDFTPNPTRAIWIRGRLDWSMLERLRPRIVALVSESSAPITLFLDSTGGYAHVAQAILSCLRYPRAQERSACRVITVALGRASSAATDLLVGGDVAFAQRDTMFLFHGVGWRPDQFPGRITSESAAEFAADAKAHNEQRAASFARACLRRSLFIIRALRPEFEEHRAAAGNPNLSDLNCFQRALRSRLSPQARQVVRRARALSNRSNALASCFIAEISGGRPSRRADLERLMLNASVAFEYKRRNRLLSAGGLSRINEHFYFLKEFVGDERGDAVGDFCGPSQTSDQPSEGDRTYFLPFFMFLIAVYRALGIGENELTSTDALYLGLVDSIRDLDPAWAESVTAL